jgi:hypothetical protein
MFASAFTYSNSIEAEILLVKEKLQFTDETWGFFLRFLQYTPDIDAAISSIGAKMFHFVQCQSKSGQKLFYKYHSFG